nr:MAG TPA: hypothetical protein [Caudoviricetes sp.]
MTAEKEKNAFNDFVSTFPRFVIDNSGICLL